MYRSKWIVRIKQIWDRGMHTKKPLMFPHGKLLTTYSKQWAVGYSFQQNLNKKMWKPSGSMKRTRLEIGNHKPERCRHVPYIVTAGPTEEVGRAQLPGSLFSPSDISKKLSHHFLLHFWINIGPYDHHAKYQGVFMGLLWNTFFIRVPPLDKEDLNEFKGWTLMKKVFHKSPKNTPWYFAWWS